MGIIICLLILIFIQLLVIIFLVFKLRRERTAQLLHLIEEITELEIDTVERKILTIEILCVLMKSLEREI